MFDLSEQPRMAQSEPSASVCSLLQMIVLLVIALIMIGIGHSFSDDCNNGATDFLVIGGWISFALSILTLIFSSLGLCIQYKLLYIQMFLPLVRIVDLIWVTPMIILLWTF